MLIFCYVFAMVAANMSVWYFGPWISPINSFLFIGLDLTLRDKLHEKHNGNIAIMLCIVLSASVVTYILNPAAQNIAIASSVAFAAAAFTDWIVYSLLKNKSKMTRTNGSNVSGAAVDSSLFPMLAFGVFMPHIVALQFIAKVAGGAVWAYVLRNAK